MSNRRLQQAATDFAQACAQGPQKTIDHAEKVLELVALEFAAEMLTTQVDVTKKLVQSDTDWVNHSSRITKYFEPLLGLCVCRYCKNLPEFLP